MATGGMKKSVAIEVEAITQGAVKNIEKLAESTKKAREATEKLGDAQGRADGASKRSALSISAAQDAMEKFGAPLQKVQALMGAGGLVAAAGGAAVAIDKLSARALSARDVQGNLRIGLEDATRASGRLVSQFDLATNAATAMRFGVVKTSAEFGRHVEIATKLARTTGGNATKAVEDFTTALARQSPQILDNLGLQVDVEKANADYARSLHKTVDALTEAEKKQAFINAAYADAEKKIAGLTVTNDGWAISVQRTKVAAEDILDKLLALPQNVGELATEIQHATGITDKWADRMVIAARVGLAAITLGGSEAYNAIDLLNGSMSSGTTLTQLWAEAIEKLTTKLHGTTLSMEELVELQKVQGLVLSANARLIDGLNYEKTAQYFANVDEEARKEEAAKAKAAAAAAAKASAASAEAYNGFANRAATSQWDKLIEARDAGRTATKEQHDRDFQGLDEKFDLIQEQKAGGERRKADSAFADSMRGTQIGAARGGGGDDPHQAELLRISETLAAQEEYYGKLRTLTDDAGEQAAISEDLKAARHAAELARIAEESSAREEAYGRQMAIAGKVGDSLGAVAAAYVQAGDWSAKGFRKAVGEFAKAEAISMGVVAIREGVLAIASAASFNFPQAAAHGIASGVAAAQALVLGGIAAGMGSGGSGAVKTKQVAGFTGSDFGPGAANEPAANEAPTVSNSQTDTVAVSGPDGFRAESNAFAGPPSGSHGGSNVYQFAPGSIMTLGAIDDQTATKLAQGFDRATKRKGRLVG